MAVITAAVVFGLAGWAHAITIPIDPGAVGSSFSELTIGFTELDGDALNGQNIILDFVFTDMKHLEVDTDPSATTESFGATLIINHDSGVILVADVNEAFLSDENGASIFSFPFLDNSAAFGAMLPGAGAFATEADGVIFHDIHFDITLPTAIGNITSAELIIIIEDPSVLRVGEWAPNNAVPEPITATLGLMGLGVLGMATRRRVA